MRTQSLVNEENNGETTINSGTMILIILLVWAFIGGSSILVAKYSKPKKVVQKKTSKSISEELIKKVGMLYDLPKGEVPTIATVSDKTKLEKQDFFAKAENGDNILIYTKAKKAVLYRPSLNKVMEVTSISLNPTITPSKAPSTK